MGPGDGWMEKPGYRSDDQVARIYANVCGGKKTEAAISSKVCIISSLDGGWMVLSIPCYQ